MCTLVFFLSVRSLSGLYCWPLRGLIWSGSSRYLTLPGVWFRAFYIKVFEKALGLYARLLCTLASYAWQTRVTPSISFFPSLRIERLFCEWDTLYYKCFILDCLECEVLLR